MSEFWKVDYRLLWNGIQKLYILVQFLNICGKMAAFLSKTIQETKMSGFWMVNQLKTDLWNVQFSNDVRYFFSLETEKVVLALQIWFPQANGAQSTRSMVEILNISDKCVSAW